MEERGSPGCNLRPQQIASLAVLAVLVNLIRYFLELAAAGAHHPLFNITHL